MWKKEGYMIQESRISVRRESCTVVAESFMAYKSEKKDVVIVIFVILRK